jgi:hypothetical protein
MLLRERSAAFAPRASGSEDLQNSLAGLARKAPSQIQSEILKVCPPLRTMSKVRLFQGLPPWLVW